MPQLSLYLDDVTMEALRKRASLRGVSLSRYASELVKQDAAVGWPEGYWDLYGSVDDDAFAESEDDPFVRDGSQEDF